MARHPKDLPKRLRAQFKTSRGALVIDKHGRLRDRLRITAARWKALKAVNFDERLLPDAWLRAWDDLVASVAGTPAAEVLKASEAARIAEGKRHVAEIRGENEKWHRFKASYDPKETTFVAQLDKTVILRGRISDFNLDVPEAHNGCQCSCHRNSGVIHCVPCCYPTLRPESP